MGTQTQYGPRTYGNRTNNTWKEEVCDSGGSNCRTETYYVTVQDPGDGGPFGASGNLAGKTTVYKRNDGIIGWLTGQSGDIIVGEIPAYGPNKGKLIRPPNVAPGSPLDNTITHFSEPDNLKRVKNQAILTTKKGMLADKDVYGNDIEPVTDDPEVADKESRKLLDKGSALNPPTGEGDGTTKPAKSIEDREGTRNNFGNYMYPENLGETTQDIIKFDMIKWAKPTKSKAGWGFEREKFNNEQGTRNSIGSVILPIPGGIKDSNKAEWGGKDLDALQMSLYDLANGAITKGTDGAGEAFANIDANIRGSMQGGNLQKAIGTAFAGAAIGKDFKTLSGRFTGQIMNPNMELLFGGPSLRPFSFSFLLAPRSKTEAKQVVQIIRFFKQGMAPIRSKANLFLKSPHTFQLQYKHRGAEHPYLNRFKECALTSCSVNYTPEQSYSTYEDGVMTAYSMTLEFTELEPVYNDDYENNDDGSARVNFASGSGPILPENSEKLPAEIGF